MEGAIGVGRTAAVSRDSWCGAAAVATPQVSVQNKPAEDLKGRASSDSARRTMLYVEDNPANMQLIKEIIGRFPNIGLITAVNGTLGVELARAALPQVILMDINLPGISGIEALKILREDPATAHIPVIALSANAMPRDVRNGLDAGFLRYLTKPVKITELMNTLSAALQIAGKRSAMGTDEEPEEF